MYNKEQLNSIYEQIIKTIDISHELFDKAEKEYQDMGSWIDKETPDYEVNVYAQGSFALGTVIKPVKDSEDYDLDLVCELKKQYGLLPEALKCDVVKPLLEKYKKIRGKIEEKRRCWHVEYEELSNFHMDIIPAVNRSKYIDITDHNEEDNTYDYIGSNPKGYIAWFESKKAERREILLENYRRENLSILKCSADVEKIKEYHLKTPLQKAIQILKRHRDIMFADDSRHNKPISIIITTIAAELYNNEDNIVNTLTNILENAEDYIMKNMVGTEYHVDNPSYTGKVVENFADKWNQYPERAEAFFLWVEKAKNDLICSNIYDFYRTEMAENLGRALGNTTIEKVFNEMAMAERKDIETQVSKLSIDTGIISKTGTIPIPQNHNHGKI